MASKWGTRARSPRPAAALVRGGLEKDSDAVLEQARAQLPPNREYPEPGIPQLMAERNLLVVLLADPFKLRLCEAIEQRGGGAPNVHS
ncbi:MAG: hypothetical protein ACRDO9_02830, partial [Gaiellales bacterium]